MNKAQQFLRHHVIHTSPTSLLFLDRAENKVAGTDRATVPLWSLLAWANTLRFEHTHCRINERVFGTIITVKVQVSRLDVFNIAGVSQKTPGSMDV